MPTRDTDTTFVPHVIPHRVPFLFVDRLITRQPGALRLLRAVTRNDALLQGERMLPPSLVFEAIIQGALVLLASVCSGAPESTRVTEIERFASLAPVRVGEQLIVEVELQQDDAGGHVVAGRAVVNGEVRAEGTLRLASEPT